MNYNLKFLFAAIVLGGLFLITGADVSAQGRGNGRGNGGGQGMGRPAGVGVDRGLGNAGIRSDGRSDDGLGNASMRSNGRSDAGLERARMQRQNSDRADRELREHPQIARVSGRGANELRAGYRQALLTNPELKFGNYVAANMLARQLGSRYPGVTTSAILAGLADGDSIGETLRSLGVGKDEAKRAEKDVKRRIDEAKD